MSVALITGSAGLIGSEACQRFHAEGLDIAGVDNDMRRYFFGEAARPMAHGRSWKRRCRAIGITARIFVTRRR